MIVDDEASNRKSLVRALGKEGYHVVEAENGHAALAQLRTKSFSVMLSDLKMPQMNGLELLQKAKQQYPALEVIVMTAYGTVETAVQAMKEGACDFIAKPIKRAELIRSVHKALEKHRLVAENRALKSKLAMLLPDDWIGNSQAMRQLTAEARQVADSEASIFLVGESGTGKSMLARWIHNCSPRKGKKLITINCGAIPENLLESELFGHEAGAFTGARTRRKGKFEQAQGGTLFFDEVTEMSPHLQVKLLRVLQDGEFERLGGSETIKTDIRILAATNQDPETAIAEGTFRKDLFYRLNVIPLRLPSLRERTTDIPLLARHFASQHAKRNRRSQKDISPAALQILADWNWPGNVRELENVIERAVVLSTGEQLQVDDLPHTMRNHIPAGNRLVFHVGTTLKAMERKMIIATLKAVDGDKNRAAEMLGISARSIYRRELDWEPNES